MARKLSDSEIIAALEAEESLAIDGASGELALERSRALERYQGQDNEHPAPEGRSNIVSRDVTDVIESIMPSIVRVFLGGEDIGQFEARGPEDEDAAKAETEVVNWYLTQKSDYFSVINASLRDALLLKNGYIVAYWKTKSDVMSEVYTGQSDEELALLMQDEEVEVVEHTSYPDPTYEGAVDLPNEVLPDAPPMGQPPMLHDVKVERKSAEEYVAIESVPPDEILVSRHARVTSLMECDFVQWKRTVSIGQLRAEGFDVADDEPGYDDMFTGERAARERYFQNTVTEDGEADYDPSRRMVVFRDTYIRMDLDGNGEPKLWRIARVSGADKLALKSEVECVPFAAFSPLVYPHSHIGTSIFDLVDDVGLIKTQLQRNLLDGQYLALSGQAFIDVNRVNMDDMLVSRPGGVKRVDGTVDGAYMPMPFADSGPSTLQALGYMDSVRVARTGVTGTHDAIEANTLNRTATGVQATQSANNLRIELIARTLAGGFRDLFLITHALALKHSTKPLQIKLKGAWTTCNPREWKRRTDFILNVGLGTGTPEAQMMKLLSLQPMMQAGVQTGMVGAEELYNYACEVWKAAGYRSHTRFVQEPQKDPQTGKASLPAPQPDPKVQVTQMQLQADAQKTQAVHQHELQLKQIEQQDSVHKFQADQALKQQENQQALELQRSNDIRQSQLDQQKAALEAQGRAQEMELKRYEIELGHAAKREIETAKIQAQMQMKQMELQHAQTLANDAKNEKARAPLVAPKVVLRDERGKVVGLDHGGVVHDVVRDAHGRIAGLRPRQHQQGTMQ